MARKSKISILVDKEKCTGCRACAYICPIGVPVVNPDSGKTMMCDLCAEEDSQPRCVQTCRDCGALTIVDLGNAAARKSRDRAEGED